MTRLKFLGGLGFRNLELFNLALLARQSWRIPQEPNSVDARILKAVNFPSSSFLDAALGSHPYQIWRVILDRRGILEQGLIKRIEDVHSTSIRLENWLPSDILTYDLCCHLKPIDLNGSVT
jgi:hypothetical protein